MNLQELANLGEFIGGMAVVLTLMYFAFELRRNTASVRSSSAGESQDSLADINKLLASDSELASILSKAMEDGTLKNLNADESFRITLLLRANMQIFESMYFKFESGVLEERVWTVRRDWMSAFLQISVIAEWWSLERVSSFFTQEFINDIESSPGFTMNNKGQRVQDAGAT